jgi:hypothetical protein
VEKIPWQKCFGKKNKSPGEKTKRETHLKDTKELGKWEQRHHTSIVIFI